jgi:uncharacterized membrane protein
MYFPLLFVVVQLAAFIPNHSAALRLKEERGWEVSTSTFAETKTSFTRGCLYSMPWAWYIAGIIISVASGIVALAVYPSMPDAIATHFDINMTADAWSVKSVGLVLMMPIFNVGITVVMWLAGVAIEKAKLQIDAHNPALSFAQHKAYRKQMGHALGLTSFAINVMFMLIGFTQLWPDFRVAIWVSVALPLIPCVLIAIVSVRAGQGGCKLKLNEIGNDENAAARGWAGSARYSDDRFWALGMFYHNPDDPAILVENRFGGNIGFNYSRTAVKIGAAVGVIATVAIYACFTVWWLGLIA